MVVAQLSPETTHEELADYLREMYPKLASLLPDDVESSELFTRVEQQRPLKRAFRAFQETEAEAIAFMDREFERLEMNIETWRGEGKAVVKKRKALDTKKEKAKKKQKQPVEPPGPPVMSFEEAELAATNAKAEREKKRREAVLSHGVTQRFRMPGNSEAAGTEHLHFFKGKPKARAASDRTRRRLLHRC